MHHRTSLIYLSGPLQITQNMPERYLSSHYVAASYMSAKLLSLSPSRGISYAPLSFSHPVSFQICPPMNINLNHQSLQVSLAAIGRFVSLEPYIFPMFLSCTPLNPQSCGMSHHSGILGNNPGASGHLLLVITDPWNNSSSGSRS